MQENNEKLTKEEKTEKRQYNFKPVDDLEFTDDFMFGTIMQDEEICKGVLERLLKTKIAKIEYPKLQETVTPFYEAKGVRLDVYVDDGATIYDIEMQCKKLDAIEKRVRYYQSMIDIDSLSKGADYSELKESFVIFICKTDPFTFDCPSYEVKSKIEGTTFIEELQSKEDKKAKKPKTFTKKEICENYNDGTHKLFFNAKAYQNETDTNLKAFLHYVSTTEATDDFTKNLEDKIMMTKQIDKFRNDYLSWNLAERDAEKRGEERKAIETAKKLILINALSIEQIAQVTGLSISQIMDFK